MNNKTLKKDLLFLIIIFASMFICFYRLAICSDTSDHSLFAHKLEKSLLDLLHGESVTFPKQVSYPGWHFAFCLFYKLFRNDSIASAVTNSLFVILESIVLLWGFRKNGFSIKKSYLYTIFMIFVGPLFWKPINENYYLGQLPANVWHNPTIISVKPFMLLALFLTIEILKDNQKIDRKKFTKLAICMLVSCLFKPSFMQIYGLALVIFCVVYTIVTKGNFFKKAVAFAISCIPTALLMIIQYLIFYGGILKKATESSNGSDGIGFSLLYVWGSFTDHVLGSLLLSIAFPLCIFIFLYKKTVVKPTIQLAISILVSGVGCFACLYNIQGTFQADFAWGAYLSVAAVFVIACIGLEELRGNVLKYRIGFSILLLHFIFGFIYWVNVFVFRDYNGDILRIFTLLI